MKLLEALEEELSQENQKVIQDITKKIKKDKVLKGKVDAIRPEIYYYKNNQYGIMVILRNDLVKEDKMNVKKYIEYQLLNNYDVKYELNDNVLKILISGE